MRLISAFMLGLLAIVAYFLISLALWGMSSSAGNFVGGLVFVGGVIGFFVFVLMKLSGSSTRSKPSSTNAPAEVATPQPVEPIAQATEPDEIAFAIQLKYKQKRDVAQTRFGFGFGILTFVLGIGIVLGSDGQWQALAVILPVYLVNATFYGILLWRWIQFSDKYITPGMLLIGDADAAYKPIHRWQNIAATSTILSLAALVLTPGIAGLIDLYT